MNLTFRILVNIHFKKYTQIYILKSYLYYNNGDLEPIDKKHLL